jgi:hypothetical protein
MIRSSTMAGEYLPGRACRDPGARRPYIGNVQAPSRTELELLPGARELLAAHARELPQRDDLCGAFCAALALHAAGMHERHGEPLDQDAVEDSAVSGTTAAGLLRAVEELSGGSLLAIPYGGPWSTAMLHGLFDLAAALAHPVSLVANLATRHLWGSRPRLEEILAHLYEGALEGPEPDWDVGHFACVPARLRGPGGSLFCIADTYASLGLGGLHLQPAELLARALERRDMPAGGMFVVVSRDDSPSVRAGAARLGLVEGLWDNGTVGPEALR